MDVATIVALAGAIGGAASGLAGSINDMVNSWNYYQGQIDANSTNKNLTLADLLLDFQNAEKEAYKNADKADALSTIDETYLSNLTNNNLASLSLSQVAEGLQYNQAAQNIAQNTGNALSQQANSGIRAGGSLSSAIEMEAAQNSAQLQLAEDTQRNQDDLQLANILNDLNKNTFNIQSNRTDAMDLRNSFKAGEIGENGLATSGGYNWQKYQNAKTQTETRYNQQYNELRTAQMENEGWSAFWKGATAMLSLGAKGAQTAVNAGNFVNDNIKPIYDYQFTFKNGFTKK